MKFIYLLNKLKEMEKTLDELKSENELLNQQLSVISEKLKGLGEILLEGKERNVKLTYAIRLFAETHLTREEKLAIAQEFDRAINAEHVERIYKKYIEQISPPGIDEIDPDFLWSPGFSRELEKYYFQHKGYNPFEIIDSAAKIIRLQFKIEDDLRLADNPEKIQQLRESWETNRESSMIAVDEIINVTNEILKK